MDSVGGAMNGTKFTDLPYELASKGDIRPSGTHQVSQLPASFPSHVESPMLWKPADLAQKSDQWISYLGEEDVSAIEQSMDAFIASKADLQTITPETFPLPQSLTAKLHSISECCYNGLGFCILRGFPSSNISQLEKAVLFGGVSAHVASERGFQDIDRKHVLAHLFKRYATSPGEYIPPSFDNTPLAFHTDDGDIVALYYPSFTEKGGKTQLASQPLIYNELAMNRPDLLKVLADEWLIDRYYRPDLPPRQVPLLHHYGEGDITIQYTRLPFSRYKGSRAPRPDIPPLTSEQIEALDALQTLATKNSFPVPTQSGDILFFNNMGLFHGRESYEEPGNAETVPTDMDRHVLRLWLRDPSRTSKLSSPTLQQIWDEIYGPNTSGGRKETWNVNAIAAFAMNADKNG